MAKEAHGHVHMHDHPNTKKFYAHGGKVKKMADGGSMTGGFPKTDRYGATEHSGTSFRKGGRKK